jgi:4-amino-4-deoxy-L-arabinose transferase-like glycosyltransferase
MSSIESRPQAASSLLAERLQRPVILVALLAVWLLATLGWRALLVPDEGRYAEVARTMLSSGDAWVPVLNGLPFFHKPPLFYWIDLGAMKLLGSNVFAGRFGSALGAWVMGATLLLAMRRWHGARVAAIALGVLATTPFFFVGAQYANHDMLVAGLISAAVLAFARAVEEPSQTHLKWLQAGWALCALAMLAKGLIGIVLPAFVIGPWLLAQGRWRQTCALLHPLGLLVFAAIAAPWFISMQSRYPEFFDYFFMEQHFRRFAQSNFNNVHGPWFFIVVMPALTLPWSVWLPAAVRRLTAKQRELHPLRSAPRATLGLYAWWVIAVLGFFSMPSSKLVGYVLPALAPWCALLSIVIAQRDGTGRQPAGGAPVWSWVMGAAAIACVAIVGVTAWKAPQSNRALALALAQHAGRDDRVVMVDAYFYDVPFYARLEHPVIVVSDWADPDLPMHDNWRKELFDAASFNPVLGASILRPLETLDSLACGVGTVWFIASNAQAARVARVQGASQVFHGPRAGLWRAPGRTCN